MAGRPCFVCTHPNRVTIDKRLASNDPVRQIAKELGIPKSTLQSHKNRCTGLKELTPLERTEPTRATIALATLPSKEEMANKYADLGARIDQIIAAAEGSGSLMVAISGLGQLRQTFDSISKLAGHTMPAPAQVQVNVAINAETIGFAIAKHLKTIDAATLEEVVE